MAAEIKVSILCTAFNHEKYLRSALDGFLAQKTNFAFEVLVNDDCSSDGTAEILRQYADRYPNIIVPFYQEENLYSQHIDIYEEVFFPNARGSYFAFCEGDDYWLDADKLQRQVDFLDAHEDYSACAHGSYQHICDADAPDKEYIHHDSDCDIPYTDILKGMSNAYHTSSLVARRTALLPLPEFYSVGTTHLFGDYPMALWLAIHGKTRFLSGLMSVYRIRSGSSSWTASVNGGYGRLTGFVIGEIAVLEALRRQAPQQWFTAIDETILSRKYELLYLEGKTAEMMKPPYDKLYRQESLNFRLKTGIKHSFPALHGLYRKYRGYNDD